MMKLKQKILGGFRSVVGAQILGRIRGYISTLKKQGLNILDALKQVFLGNSTMPTMLQPEWLPQPTQIFLRPIYLSATKYRKGQYFFRTLKNSNARALRDIRCE
ncbi:MAG: hypothetical protein ACFE0J_18660 [Elainellaceae cyanobacterium]